MKTSMYFEQTLFYDQSSASRQLYDEKSGRLFEVNSESSVIEIHVQPPSPSASDDLQHANVQSDAVLKWWSAPAAEAASICSSLSRAPTLAAEQNGCSPPDSPRSVGPPGLQSRRIWDPELLRHIAANSKRHFRMCFIRQRHSYARLQITRELFDTLMFQFSIFPRFREFVLLFGAKHGENEIMPPQMRFRWLAGNACNSEHRTAAGFECAYVLRYVELNYRQKSKPWSIRQTAVYHKYEVNQQCSTWVLIAASGSAEARLDEYIKNFDSLAGLNPFEAHLIIFDTALANWRPRIVDLTEKVTAQSSRVLMASISANGPPLSLDNEARQELKDFQDQVIDVLVVLDSILDTIAVMIEKYNQFSHDIDTPLEDPYVAELDPIQIALREKQQEALLSKKKVEALNMKIQGTISLLSDLLNLGTGHSLQRLAEEARQENMATRGLTEKATRDAAAVKVLTIITLIYLPATVVSNFFSTQFVSQQTQADGQPEKVVILSNAWLYAAISLPLTVGTLFFWWLWVKIQAHQIHPGCWRKHIWKALSRSRKARRNQREFSLGMPEEFGHAAPRSRQPNIHIEMPTPAMPEFARM